MPATVPKGLFARQRFCAQRLCNTIQLYRQVSIQLHQECFVVPGTLITTQYNTIQYNFIVNCQYNCTRNVLWYQVLSSQHNTIQYNFIVKCQYNCTMNVLWCRIHSSHIHTNHKTSLDYNNSKQTSRQKDGHK